MKKGRRNDIKVMFVLRENIFLLFWKRKYFQVFGCVSKNLQKQFQLFGCISENAMESTLFLLLIPHFLIFETRICACAHTHTYMIKKGEV